MYCPKCGTDNPDGAQLCRACSWAMTSIASTAPAPDAKTSRLAIAALVLAILSPFTCMITMIPAVICGIVALVKINKSAGRLKGKGMAIAGIVTPAAIFPVALIMSILMPALARVRELSQRAVCGTNVKGIAMAMALYANDYDDKYPTASNWCDLLIEGDYITEKQLTCKNDPDGPCSYAINKNAQEAGPSAPPNMVLLFETEPGWNQSGGPQILNNEIHHGEGCNIAFVDGTVRFVRPGELQTLKWTAEPDR